MPAKLAALYVARAPGSAAAAFDVEWKLGRQPTGLSTKISELFARS